MKIDIGPITRIEGHLNVQTTVENGVVTDARCEGEMFRGFEIFLRGRDPLDSQQITQRICGVCPYAHAIASSMAQENAYRLSVPPNGRILHNLIQGANHLYDYLLHFYQLCALDYVDITSVLEYSGKDPELSRVRDWVRAEIDSGQRYPATPFLPRLSGRYLNDRDTNLGAIKNYLEAMSMEKKANQAAAIFGGKFPHATSIFPGGCTQEARVDLIVPYQSLISEVRDFIHNKYIPDVLAVAGAFPEYWEIGRSRGGFLSHGHLPLGPRPDNERLLAAGVMFDGRVEAVNFDQIRQHVNSSLYSSPTNLQVRDAAITPQPDKSGAYSWIMAPRYAGKMVEVGPAARIMVDYAQGHNQAVKELTDRLTGRAGVRVSQLNSVMGRHLSRAILAAVLADFLLEESQRLTPGEPTMAAIDPPASAEGFGATEASRGALLHYIRIENYKIAKYECVVPTTWNASPRDDQGQPGAMESALIGTRVNNPEEQIESKRIVRSFDPCLACAVH